MHGNYGNIEHFNSITKSILDLNYDLLIYDYRGYGKSSGKIRSEKEFLSDANLALDYALKHYKKARLLYWI